MKKVLIISPAFNEAKLLPNFIEAFLHTKDSLKNKADLRLLIVNDGSTDSTIEKLKSFQEEHRDIISYVSFVANFGYQAALTAGLMNIGHWPDAVITMDCDLEHPIELVSKMVEMWDSQKFILIQTIRKEHKGLSFKKRFFSNGFYFLATKMTGLNLQSGQADFRLWDAQVVRSMQAYLPHLGSLRVFAAWLPGKKGYLEYEQHLQGARESRFTFKKSWELAVISLVRFSHAPLKVILFLGVSGLLFSASYGVYIILQVLKGNTIPGWTSLILTVIGMSCFQLISLGIVALYLQRLVFAKDLPLYLIQEKKGSIFNSL